MLRMRLNRPRLGTDGIALPLALLGLVAVTLMATSAVLISSTEVAVGAAHQDGVASLYQSDGGLEALVATNQGATGPTFVPNSAEVVDTLPSPDGLTEVVIKRLRAENDFPDPADPVQTAYRHEVFSFEAVPVSGRGRKVGALLRTVREAPVVNFNIKAGAISGGNVKARGNAELADNSDMCLDEHGNPIKGEAAIQMTAGATLDAEGSVTIDGDVENLDVTKEELEAYLFGPGMTLDSVAKLYGTLYIEGQPAKRSNAEHNITSADSLYNWGCPRGMWASCDTSTYKTRFETIVIDASTAPGSTAKISGDYGQGMLIVVNGSLELSGNFLFKGMILVEEDIRIGGGGGRFDGKIEGAVVALGDGSEIDDRFEGGAVIHYNQCANSEAMQEMTIEALNKAPQRPTEGTYAWREIF